MRRFLLWTSLVALMSIFVVPPATAQSTATTPLTTIACNASNFFGFPSWDSCLRKKYGGELKITDLNDVWLVILPIIEAVIRATGYIAVGFIIWGGVKYIKSQGEPKETAAARSTILNAIIGLVIVLLSVAIVQFVSGRF